MKLLIPPPLQGLIAGIAIWGLAQWAPDLVTAYSGQKTIAGGLIASGLVIDLISIIAFFRAKTTISPLSPEKTNTLVLNGLYRFSRNPMYLGMLLVLLGWSLWFSSPLTLIPIILFVLSITWLQIKPEEAALTEKFGENYTAYQARVRRWI